MRFKKDYVGEQSPYWDWVRIRQSKTGASDHALEQFKIEPVEANPDAAAEIREAPINRTHQKLKSRWRNIKFSPMEFRVLKLMAQGLNQAEVSQELKLTRNRVAQIILRIRRKGDKLYGNILATEGL